MTDHYANMLRQDIDLEVVFSVVGKLSINLISDHQCVYEEKYLNYASSRLQNRDNKTVFKAFTVFVRLMLRLPCKHLIQRSNLKCFFPNVCQKWQG